MTLVFLCIGLVFLAKFPTRAALGTGAMLQRLFAVLIMVLAVGLWLEAGAA
jgi:hypothetical protein